MRILFYLLVCISVISCKSEKKPFLDFDQIDYYCVSISDEMESNMYDKKRTFEEETFLKILHGDISINLKNDSLVKQIESTNFFKLIEIPAKLNKEVSQCFLSNSYSQASLFSVSTICAHIYRDILIFKKDKKIVGVVFVCFSCYGIIYHSKNGYERIKINFVELEKVLNKLKN